TNSSPIRTKGRPDSSGSKRTPIVTVLDTSHQTESPVSIMPGVNSFGVINELVHEDLPKVKISSFEEQTEEFKEEIGYSSANSVNEDRSINEQQQKSRPISQVSSSSINSEKYEPNANDDFKHYNNQPEVEINGDSKSDTNINYNINDTINDNINNNINDNIYGNINGNINDNIYGNINGNINDEVIDNIQVTDTNKDLKSSTAFSHYQEKSSTVTTAPLTPPKSAFSHYQEKSSTVTTAPLTPPKFPMTPGFVGEEIQHDYLSRDIEQDRKLENNIVQNGQVYHVTHQIVPLVSQDTVITQEIPQIHQKIEQLQTTNESLNNINSQLESKVDEQSQQISRLSSLESIVIRQLELAERMEETMRRLETKVNQQKEEIDGLMAGRMEDTIRRLEYKLNEQNKELEGLKMILGQLYTNDKFSTIVNTRSGNSVFSIDSDDDDDTTESPPNIFERHP
ncbi:35950_t:CDS:2, partial [Racocetra persica]